MYNRNERRLCTANELADKFRIAHFLVWQIILVATPVRWKQLLAAERPQSTETSVFFQDLKDMGGIAKWARKKLTATISRDARESRKEMDG